MLIFFKEYASVTFLICAVVLIISAAINIIVFRRERSIFQTSITLLGLLILGFISFGCRSLIDIEYSFSDDSALINSEAFLTALSVHSILILLYVLFFLFTSGILFFNANRKIRFDKKLNRIFIISLISLAALSLAENIIFYNELFSASIIFLAAIYVFFTAGKLLLNTDSGKRGIWIFDLISFMCLGITMTVLFMINGTFSTEGYTDSILVIIIYSILLLPPLISLVSYFFKKKI